MLGLYLTAELNNVTDLTTEDSVNEPFEYFFKLECTKCHEVHDKLVSVNLYEKHEISDSRGEASYVSSCTFCNSKSNLNIQIPKHFNGYTNEDNGKSVKILEIDSRGYEIVEFIAQSPFKCKGLNSETIFDKIDLSENEWYDYDDNAGEETSITDIKWEIK